MLKKPLKNGRGRSEKEEMQAYKNQRRANDWNMLRLPRSSYQKSNFTPKIRSLDVISGGYKMKASEVISALQELIDEHGN